MEIGAVDDKTFGRVWKVVEELGTQERHFNDLQTGYRNMASVWLLATFSAIGFVVSESVAIGIARELLIAGIALAGCIGILLLWVVDLLVYHRLLDSCFVEGLLLEKRHSWLPSVRHNMMTTQAGKGVLFRVVGFYLAPAVLLILVAGGALSLWISPDNAAGALVSSGVTVVVAWLTARFIQSRTENTAAIERRLASAARRH